jgi:hypothetical protein
MSGQEEEKEYQRLQCKEFSKKKIGTENETGHTKVRGRSIILYIIRDRG